MLLIMVPLLMTFLMFSIMIISPIIKPLNFNNMTPFECGIEAKETNLLFSMRFFSLTLIFLIFDIELVILIPIPFMLINSNLMTMMMMMPFTLTLFLTLIYEWCSNSLEWNYW